MKTTTNEVTANHDQQLFVIPSNGGYSCLGFEVCRRKREAITNWLHQNGAPVVFPDVPNDSIEAYNQYLQLCEKAATLSAKSGQRCTAELSPQLDGLEGYRVEVETTYGETRRFIVGKSTGWMPCHLEIARRNSYGGGAAEKQYNRVTKLYRAK